MNGSPCSKCGQAAHFKCERCLEPYCSSECQVTDWQEHKTKCYKFPDLIPMNILKNAVSNLSLNKHDGGGGYNRRSHGSFHHETRRSNNSLAPRSRNPTENGEYNGAKPKKDFNLSDDHFTLLPKTTSTPITCNTPPNVEKNYSWRVAYSPPTDFFDVIVQFIEEVQDAKRIVWVTDLKYDVPLKKLLAEMNRIIDQAIPCNEEEIYAGALVAAPLDKVLYRAEVLDTSPEAKRANTRLIDYGNELRVPYSQVFAPIPIMANLNAYSIRVSLPNDCGPLDIESTLTIKVVGEKEAEGYYNVVCKKMSIPLHLPIELLGNEPTLTVVKCFQNGRNALLRLCNGVGIGTEDLNLDAVLNSAQTISFDFEFMPNEGAFVAARTLRGWRRACFLGFYEKQHQFLVYTIDEGAISLSPQIKHIPEAFVTQPMRVFAISTNSPDYMLSDDMLTTAKKLSLRLLPTATSITNKDPKAQLHCSLFADTRKIVDVVVASVFSGSLSQLGLKLWHDHVAEGSTVFVTQVITYKEIYIASHETKEYSKIFMSEYLKCLPFTAEENINKGDVVLFCDAEDDKQYRGEIISCSNNLYKTHIIDSGIERIVSREALRKPTQLVRSLPVRCSLVKLMFLKNIATPIANNKALEALEMCMVSGTEFDVTYGDNTSDTVDLLFHTKEQQSLCKKLLPMIFESRSGELPPSPPNTPITTEPPVVAFNPPVLTQKPEPLGAAAVVPNKAYTLDDLEKIPIVCGDKVPLYVLDPSTVVKMDDPYITAADSNNEQMLAEMDRNLKMVSEYCTSSKAPEGGYAPKKMEICLSVFAQDGEWYRALCVDHKPNDTFLVMFLDYGNISKVNKKDIMPITPELMFPYNANMVYLKGITTKEQALKLKQQLERSPILYAKVSKFKGDAYLAQI